MPGKPLVACIHESFAPIWVAHDEFPISLGLATEYLYRLVVCLNCLSRVIDPGTLKVGGQLSDIADDDGLNDATMEARFRGDQLGQIFANPLAADQCLAGSGHEAGIWFVKRHDRIEIASVKMLLENTRPILRLIR